MKPQPHNEDPLAFIDELALAATKCALTAAAVVVAILLIALL